MSIKILSVDLDWIMEPSINMYNGLASGNTNLDEFLKQNPGISLEGDLDKYKTLSIYLKNICNKITLPDRIQFRINHDEIINCIDNIWKLDKEKYDIYNIDHHHDCGYGIEKYSDVVDQGLTCGNWVMYCKNLRNYTWINNKNSDCGLIDEIIEKLTQFTYVSDINLINFINFDYVFVCLSPGWVPNKYFPLFDILENYHNKEDIITN